MLIRQLSSHCPVFAQATACVIEIERPGNVIYGHRCMFLVNANTLANMRFSVIVAFIAMKKCRNKKYLLI